MKLFLRRSSIITGLVAIVAMMLVGCGSTSSTSTANGVGCMKVGVLMPESSSSARWESKDHPLLLSELKAAMGNNVQIDYSNANGDDALQLTQAETDLTKGDCILILAPHDATAASAIVDKAFAQKVPVISYDRLIYDTNLAYYVSFDNVKVGELQGQYIVDHYKDFVSPGHNNLVMIEGSPTDNNETLFTKGDHNKLDPLISSGALKLVYEQPTKDWDNPTAQVEMDAALTANHNDIQVAMVQNDGMAQTAIAALKAQHLNGKVLVTGQDATTDGIRNILLGDQSMTVYKAIALEAKGAAQLAAAISKGTSTSSIVNGTTTHGSQSTPSVLEIPVAVDKTNIATTVIADGFVTKADVCKDVPAGTDGVC
jgi:D-xylose transport system substrate-binding protein